LCFASFDPVPAGSIPTTRLPCRSPSDS
jgi:hypothetical protein